MTSSGSAPALLVDVSPPPPTAARLRLMEADAIDRLCPELEEITVTELADRDRMLPETSTSPGPFDSSVVPYARRWMDLLGDPATEIVVLCWGSQMIKSTVIENGLMYRILRQPTPIVVVQPKIEAANQWAKERLVPMILSTPALRDVVKLRRGSGATLRYKLFPGGFIFVASAQSATELASRSAPFVLLDEVDRMENIAGEGNPVEIAAKRSGAADVGTLVLTSTPRDDETTIIWPYLEGGTYEEYWVPCPHCRTLQVLIWEGITWEWGKPKEAYYVCGAGQVIQDGTPHGTPLGCGAVIEHSAKRWMLDPANGADWIARNPDAPYPSSHLPSYYSLFGKSSWGALAAEWERAQGKPGDLQVFVNTRKALLWKATTERIEDGFVWDRVEKFGEVHHPGTVPEGVGMLTAGVDVQHNRIEVWVWGWGAGLESWPVLHAVIPGDPAHEPDLPGSVWRKLDDVLFASFPHVNGGAMRITCSMVDSGYSATQVYRYTNRRGIRNVFAAKGASTAAHPILGKESLVGKQRVTLYPVGTDTAKNEFLRSQILELQAGPGFIHWPKWLTLDEAKQFVAELRKRHVDRGAVTYRWKKKRDDEPNEALDCRVYARAALERQGEKAIASLGDLAERAARPRMRRPAPSPATTIAPDAGEEPMPDADVPAAPPPPAPTIGAQIPGAPVPRVLAPSRVKPRGRRMRSRGIE